jgi:hypothetical protein
MLGTRSDEYGDGVGGGEGYADEVGRGCKDSSSDDIGDGDDDDGDGSREDVVS